MGMNMMYEPFDHIIRSWGNGFASPVGSLQAGQFDPFEFMHHHVESTQEMNKPIHDKKVQRRLAQNREAARKSRIRKKVYVQQLESSRLKLAQLEQELQTTKHKGVYNTSHLGFGIAEFEMEYNQWVEVQERQVTELRNALQVPITDIELQMLVQRSLQHYHTLFSIKANAAKADVFYLMSGVWRTSAEQFFFWIGGFRPSQLLNVLKSCFEPLNERQRADIHNLQQSSRQTEDALSQGMDQLHLNLSLCIANNPLRTYIFHMGDGMETLEALENFVTQADHLRQQTLKRMSHILTTKQSAQGLLALGEYFHRLRVLSSLWTTRPHEHV